MLDEKKVLREVKEELDRVFAEIEAEGTDPNKGIGYREGLMGVLEIALSGLHVHMKGLCINDKFYGIVTMMDDDDVDQLECNCPECQAERGE